MREALHGRESRAVLSAFRRDRCQDRRHRIQDISREALPAKFSDALWEGSLVEVRKFPKADLHCHAIFGTRIERIQEWTGLTLKKPPSRMAALDEMNSYAREVLFPHIYNREGYEFVAEGTIADAIEDGIAVLETSFDTSAVQFYDMEIDPFLDLIDRLVSRFRGRIDLRPEIGVTRDRDPSAHIPIAVECMRSGLFGSIDLYGNELVQPPETYKSLYDAAKKKGLKLKAHAGEFGSAEVVEKSIEMLQLDEVQHGVAAARSKALMKSIREKKIRLNVCPSSNVALSVAPSLAAHPIKTLVENGVRVSINSDDLTIFGRSVSEEYLALSNAGTLSPSELDDIRLDSLKP